MIEPRDDPRVTQADGRGKSEPDQHTLAEGPCPSDSVPIDQTMPRIDSPDDRGRADLTTGDGDTIQLAHPFGPSDRAPDDQATGPGPAQAMRPPRFLGEYEILEELARG